MWVLTIVRPGPGFWPGPVRGRIWPNRPVPDPDPGPVPDPSNFLNIDEVPSIFEDGGWPVWR